VLEVGSSSKFQLLPQFYIVRPSSGSIKELGSVLKTKNQNKNAKFLPKVLTK
jgi:hypothetical protein